MRAFLFAVVVGVLATRTTVRADEEKLTLDKVPAAVSAAVKKRFPKAEVLGASKEIEDGKTMYEVTIKDAGRKMDVSLTADGKLASIEKEITVKELPKKVAAALASKYPGAKYETLEEVIQVRNGTETLAYYEALLTTSDKKKVEVEIAVDGEIKKTEEKTGKKD
ncbi:MAG TPA: PepSY-like domain-containing protein [Gemmataceae bacterium]|jgi:glutamate racemase|nr:PepSY-like domain-containing protein [Gemmataceae bacterium]